MVAIRRLVTISVLIYALLVLPIPALAKQPFDSIAQLQDVHEDGQVHSFCTIWATTLSPYGNDHTFWVTAAHCMQNVDLDALLIRGEKARLLQIDEEHDLALLDGPHAQGLRIGFGDTPSAGTEIFTVGYPAGSVDPLMSKGIVSNPSAFKNAKAVFNVASGPGSSGSPVMVKGNVVVGLIQFGPCQGVCPIAGGATLKTLRIFLYGAP